MKYDSWKAIVIARISKAPRRKFNKCHFLMNGIILKLSS